MRVILAFALLFAAAGLASAQCVVFLVPPDVPVYSDETKTNLYPVVRKGYTLAFPSCKPVWKPVALVKIAERAPIPVRAACLPEDFKKSKDSSRIRAWIRNEGGAEPFEMWIPEKDLIPVKYEFPREGLVHEQSAAENLLVIQHAADLKLDSLRNADFKPPEIRNQEVFTADFRRTWSALIETFSDQKWQIESIDRDSGLITTKPASDKGGSTMACPTQFDQGNTVWLNVFVKETPGGTRVKVNATFHAMREGRAITCYSNGAIEREIFKGIQENIGPVQPDQTPARPPGR